MKATHAILRYDRKLGRHERAALTLSGAAVILGLWFAVSHSGKVDAVFLPTPSAVVASAATLAYEFDLMGDIFASLYRVTLGFLLSVCVAIPLGIWTGMHKKTEAFLNPLTSFLRYTPVSAFIPLFILWFGIGEIEKTVVIFLAIMPYLLLLVADSVANSRREFTYAALTLGSQSWQILRRVIIPQAMPAIWDSMRLVAAIGWAFVVLAEIVAAPSGLGHLIVTSQRFLKTPNVMAAIFIIAILGFVTDFLFRIGYRYFFPWTEKARHA